MPAFSDHPQEHLDSLTPVNQESSLNLRPDISDTTMALSKVKQADTIAEPVYERGMGLPEEPAPTRPMTPQAIGEPLVATSTAVQNEVEEGSPPPATESQMTQPGSSIHREPSIDPPVPPSDAGNGSDRPPDPPLPPTGDVAPSPDEGEPPINQVRDVLMGRRSMLEQSTDSYYELSNQFHERVRVAAEGGVSAEMHEDLSQNLALRDMVRSNVFPLGTALFEAERDTQMTHHFDNSLQPHGASMAGIQERAQQLAPKEVLDYFMDKLESHTTFLETGRQPDNWPEAATPDKLVSTDTLGTVRSTAEIIRVSTDSLRSELGAGAAELAQRHQAWVEETASLLLSKGNIGYPLDWGSNRRFAKLKPSARRCNEYTSRQRI